MKFEDAMDQVVDGFVKGAMRGIPDTERSRLVRSVIRDAACSAFQSGFHLARHTPESEIPTPRTAIYKGAK